MKDHHCKTYPYFIHATLTIQSHTPPPPLDKSVFSREENRLPRDKYDQLPSLAEIWPNYPPLPGTDGSRFLNIQLTEAIQTGQGKRSQVYAVRCTDSNDPLGLPTNHTIVAKFYDPTYYEIEYLSDNPFVEAGYEYSHESAIYTRCSEIQGTSIPRFFGSYTLRITRPGEQTTRLVRLILIEYINGMPMSQLIPGTFTRQQRQSILRQIVDAESALYAKDILLRDFHQRNIVIEPNEVKEGGGVRAVIIDQGLSTIGRTWRPWDKEYEDQWFPGVYISPLLRWRVSYGRHEKFEDWIDWQWQDWLEMEWKDTEAVITEAQRLLWSRQILPSTTTSPENSTVSPKEL
ncbi:hypothetical protein ABHI18_003301 [Aspergillus niger]